MLAGWPYPSGDKEKKGGHRRLVVEFLEDDETTPKRNRSEESQDQDRRILGTAEITGDWDSLAGPVELRHTGCGSTASCAPLGASDWVSRIAGKRTRLRFVLSGTRTRLHGFRFLEQQEDKG